MPYYYLIETNNGQGNEKSIGWIQNAENVKNKTVMEFSCVVAVESPFDWKSDLGEAVEFGSWFQGGAFDQALTELGESEGVAVRDSIEDVVVLDILDRRKNTTLYNHKANNRGYSPIIRERAMNALTDNVPDKFAHLNSDKFVVDYKDGSEGYFKHVYGGIAELCQRLDMDTVLDITDV